MGSRMKNHARSGLKVYHSWSLILKSSGSRAETFWPFHPSHLVLGTMEAFTTKEHVVQAKIYLSLVFQY